MKAYINTSTVYVNHILVRSHHVKEISKKLQFSSYHCSTPWISRNNQQSDSFLWHQRTFECFLFEESFVFDWYDILFFLRLSQSRRLTSKWPVIVSYIHSRVFCFPKITCFVRIPCIYLLLYQHNFLGCSRCHFENSNLRPDYIKISLI